MYKNRNHSNCVGRNLNIELLRFVLMLMICIWHTMVHGYDYKLMGSGGGELPNVQELLIMAFCVPAVNTFMLVSGYFGIRLSKDKLLRLVLQALLISNLVIIIRYYLFNGSFSFYDQVLPISSGVSWWFMTVYFVIMLLSPLLNAGIDIISIKQFKIILFFLFFIYSVVQYRLGMGGANLITMLLLYLLGRYLKKSQFHLSRLKAFIIWIISLSILYLTMIYYFSSCKYSSLWIILSYNNPTIIVMSVAILFFTLSFKRNVIGSSFLGKHSLSIYLISELLGYILYRNWSHLLDENWIVYIVSVLAFAIVCECVDVPVAKLNTYIRNIILRYI